VTVHGFLTPANRDLLGRLDEVEPFLDQLAGR
jgi:hypothetical protein